MLISLVVHEIIRIGITSFLLLNSLCSYFILNGLERVVRLLILPKQNYVSQTSATKFQNNRAIDVWERLLLTIEGKIHR